MTPDTPMFESSIPELKLVGRGKVRDLYEVDARHLLIVATDRLSAYDVVLPDPVPDKGRVLTAISNFWFRMTADLLPNHLADVELADVVSDPAVRGALEGRATVVRRLAPLPIEAIVRGYLVGSGWRDYLDTGKVCGIALPAGLEQAAELDEPLFTPATKAAAGEHDENVDFDTAAELTGAEVAARVRDAALAIYGRAREYAATRGIIVADTKFEFGLDDAGELHVIDEMLTPDSSRFWPRDGWRTGISPPSFDKQYLRDYLDTLDWDRTPPAPRLPAEVLEGTADRYREALRRITDD